MAACRLPFLTFHWLRLVWSKKDSREQVPSSCIVFNCPLLHQLPFCPIFRAGGANRTIFQLETLPSHNLLLPCTLLPQSEMAQVASLHISISRQH
ncbi:hypothetical protein CGRA01v4_03193 [Colletotrichum graminicola]|nr:hypothetical protein CGRA01v4_03193 [Colletotrichum graminicola]